MSTEVKCLCEERERPETAPVRLCPDQIICRTVHPPPAGQATSKRTSRNIVPRRQKCTPQAPGILCYTTTMRTAQAPTKAPIGAPYDDVNCRNLHAVLISGPGRERQLSG